MNIKTGTYVGTGVTGNAITGVGFAPLMLWTISSGKGGVCSIEVAGTTHSSSGLSADAAWDGASSCTHDADGFTLTNGDTSRNENGVTYYYIAFGGDGTDCDVFSYTGDGSDDRSVGAASFTPEFAVVMSSNAGLGPMFRTDLHSAGNSSPFHYTQFANYIQAFVAGGIQAGSDLNVNSAGYFVFICRKSAGVFETTAYVGNATDNRDIAHDLGVSPAWVMTKITSAANGDATWKPAALAGDSAIHVGSTATADWIQALDATNVQLGAANQTNRSGANFQLLAFGENAPAGGGSSTRHLALLGAGT